MPAWKSTLTLQRIWGRWHMPTLQEAITMQRVWWSSDMPAWEYVYVARSVVVRCASMAESIQSAKIVEVVTYQARVAVFANKIGRGRRSDYNESAMVVRDVPAWERRGECKMRDGSLMC